MREDATRRFGGLSFQQGDFSLALAQCATQFIDDVASARLIARF